MNRLIFLSAAALLMNLSHPARAEFIDCGAQDGLEQDIKKSDFFIGYDATYTANPVVASSDPGATAENVSPLGRWVSASLGKKEIKLICEHDYKSGSGTSQVFFNWPVKNLSCTSGVNGKTVCTTEAGKSLAISCKSSVKIFPTLDAPSDFKSDSGRPVVSYTAQETSPKVSANNVLTCKYQVSSEKVEYTRLVPGGMKCKPMTVAPPSHSGFDCQMNSPAPQSLNN